jgi:hypothetical protein
MGPYGRRQYNVGVEMLDADGKVDFQEWTSLFPLLTVSRKSRWTTASGGLAAGDLQPSVDNKPRYRRKPELLC